MLSRSVLFVTDVSQIPWWSGNLKMSGTSCPGRTGSSPTAAGSSCRDSLSLSPENSRGCFLCWLPCSLDPFSFFGFLSFLLMEHVFQKLPEKECLEGTSFETLRSGNVFTLPSHGFFSGCRRHHCIVFWLLELPL